MILQNDESSQDRFLSMVTHELRNPINSIALSASELRLRPQAPERVIPAVERIERAVRLLADMVETLWIRRESRPGSSE